MKKIDFKSILNINSVPMTTFILFIICVVITAALAGTNAITKNKIEALELESAKKAKETVLPADDYVEEKISYDGKNYTYSVAKDGEEIKGYLIATKTNGYGGEIEVMVGIDKAGTVTGISILSAADETPGLGANVTKKKFYSQFTGKIRDIVLKKNQANSENNEVEAVTGATISSTAVTNAVNDALDILSSVYKPEGAKKDGE